MDKKSIIDHITQNCQLIENPSLDELRSLAKKDEVTTEYGSASYVSKIRSRSKKFTETIWTFDENTKQLINKVLKYLENKELILLDRSLGQNKTIDLLCRTYVTKNYARILHFWRKSLFQPDYGDKNIPDSLTIMIPEWPETKILIDPVNKVTYILGSDYFGECKKAHLRMAMCLMKQNGGLGLHAGSKILRIKDEDNNFTDKGIIIFGLSGTGKTTLTLHDHGLVEPEKIFICQDDVVLIDQDARCFGTENNFYIKTEGLEPNQKVLYNAAIHPEAILENVFVDPNTKKIDFDNHELTKNGREIVLRKSIPHHAPNIDVSKANAIIFITRHNDIVPPVAKLTPELAVAFFMLGESIETSAGDPTKAGQKKRVVGYNPFIVGDFGEEGNCFYQILKNNPDIEYYLLNTGAIGNTDDITIKDSVTILTEIARNNIIWEEYPVWGYQKPVSIEGIDNKKLNPMNYFSDVDYNNLTSILKEERINWLNKFENLDPKIKNVF